MINIDLKKLTPKELAELKTMVTREQTLRKKDYKSGTGAFGRLYRMLGPVMKTYGASEDPITNTIAACTRSIYKLCDITLGNYHLEKSKSCSGTGITVNGRCIEIDSPEDYGHMVDDILGIIQKYKREVVREGDNIQWTR